VDAGYQQREQGVFPIIAANNEEPKIGQIEEEKMLIMESDEEKTKRIEYKPECKICLENIEIEIATMLYSCEHVFHTECLQ
jgi:hypothetical protein